jgi:hypothetical protein
MVLALDLICRVIYTGFIILEAWERHLRKILDYSLFNFLTYIIKIKFLGKR